MWLSLVVASLLLVQSFASERDFNFYWRRQQQRAKRAIDQTYPNPELEARKSNYRYYNGKTKPYFIEKWPLVNFDTGEFYSGQIPIDESDPSRKLFFIFKPAINTTSTDLTIWLNGGPGCSSLVGFFQENGPILWQAGTYEPIENPYTWALETNMLWVEQPVGTGFSTGKIEAKNERDVAKDFVGFFKNFEKLFGIENYKIYVTGESYAGRYVPYISAQMLDENDKQYFDLSGKLFSPARSRFD
jgi:carboxypeptidase D